jgi:putative tryptophan/tyrosine transport system substrate-binding protein
MRESCMYGSERGARGNSRPYRTRREFITLLGGAAAAWPLVARAQRPAMPVIGFLSSLSAPVTSKRIASFGQGLSETGYVAGRDFTIEQRLAEGQYERLPELAADLVSRRVNLIAALAPPAAFAAKAATRTIPIVFVGAFDPVKAGLVASLNRPGGNVTGVTFIGASLGAKRLELARELVPNVGIIALLTHPNSPDALEELRDLNTAAKAIGQELLVVSATSDREFETAFASIVQHRAGALLIGQDPFLFQAGGQLVALAARHRIPAIYGNSELVSAGALISYGASLPDAWRLAGVYAGRILKGAKPADLPIAQPTKFELVINLKTARAVGIAIPPTLLARADEVIE